jgi:hypothetical protein
MVEHCELGVWHKAAQEGKLMYIIIDLSNLKIVVFVFSLTGLTCGLSCGRDLLSISLDSDTAPVYPLYHSVQRLTLNSTTKQKGI